MERAHAAPPENQEVIDYKQLVVIIVQLIDNTRRSRLERHFFLLARARYFVLVIYIYIYIYICI